MSYYLVSSIDDGEPGATSTFGQLEGELEERWLLMFPGDSVRGWPTLTLTLKGKKRHESWPDLLDSDLAGLLLSTRAKDVLEPLAKARVCWLPVYVVYGTEKRAYWLLHIVKTDDVLDLMRSDGGPDDIIKPFVDIRKARGLHVFTWPNARRVLVSEVAREAVEAAQLSNFEFIQVSD